MAASVGAGAALAARRLFAAPASQAAVGGPGGSRRPNLLFVFSDQQHWQACGFEDPFFSTPNLDALAASGTVFSNSFCTTPQCSPARSSLLTGFYPSSTGVFGNMGAAGGTPLAQATIAEQLRQAGYRTAYFGKWHLGRRPAGIAGWDQSQGITEGIKDDGVTERAEAFLHAAGDDDRPFALFLSYLDPHDVYHFRRSGRHPGTPVELPESWQAETFRDKPAVQKQFMTDDQGRVIWDEDRQAWETYRAWYAECVAKYDSHLGRVMTALQSAGLDGNTAVIATSDHGDMDTHHRLIFKGPFMYEQMVRVPLVIRLPRWMGGRPGARVTAPAVGVDIAPTLLDLAGIEPAKCHGHSLLPHVTGRGAAPVRQYVISQYFSKQRWVNPIRMIRTDEWKYNFYVAGDEELYDLKNDPHELVNLAADPARAERRRQLRAELEQWIRANDDPFFSQQPVALQRTAPVEEED